jgi:hypothetical protein
MRRVVIAITVLFLLSSPALAWFDAGHKIIASIAFLRLTEAERDKVSEILRKHPRFMPDFFCRMPFEIETGRIDSREWMFQQASIWPDIARDFEDEDAQYHHVTWHFINLPHFLRPEDKQALSGKLSVNVSLDPPAKPIEEMNAIQTIRLARAMLVDPAVSKEDKAIMLCWLLHVVGDIHQPLHSSALFSRKLFPDGDLGGNRILTKQHGNLHVLWDSFPGDKIHFKTAHQDALKFMAEADLAALGEKAARQLDEKDWLEESRELAVDVVYDPEVTGSLRNIEQEGGELQAIDLSEDYLRAGGIVSRKRVVQAGYRLAAVLKEIVD